MTRLLLAAGVAALAITAPASAERGGKGGGDRAHAAQVERGGGKVARVERSRPARVESTARASRQERSAARSQRVERSSARAERTERRAVRFASVERPERATVRSERRVERAAARPERVRTERVREQRVDRAAQVRPQRAERIARVEDRRANRLATIDDRRDDRLATRTLRVDRLEALRERPVDLVRARAMSSRLAERGYPLGYGYGGCPPGLAKKPVACMPPGQAAKLIGQPLSTVARIAALDPLPSSLRSLYYDDDDYYYRYGDGYLYRVDRDRDLVAAMIPLFGGGLGLGDPFPASYMNSYVPSYYSAFYPNTPYDCPRYAYGYVYEVDCGTGMVEDIIPTYDYGYGVGQLLPSSYSYYNLPYPYRDYYTPTSAYSYRYAPGAIYRVDPTTSLITAVASLLTGNGFAVGQPMPLGYDAYNVPYAYRTSYYDSPDAWYRYNNGYIYQVDPTTRLVTAVVDAIV
jgi:hypothetical protein